MIHKYLDLSTSHVPEGFGDIVTNSQPDSDHVKFPFRVVDHEYGWIIFLREELSKEDEETLRVLGMEYFTEMVKYAVKEKCMHIYFDRDGDVDENFETFEW